MSNPRHRPRYCCEEHSRLAERQRNRKQNSVNRAKYSERIEAYSKARNAKISLERKMSKLIRIEARMKMMATEEYKQKQREKSREYRKRRYLNRHKSEHERIAGLLRARINIAIRHQKAKKCEHSMRLIGCSISQLKKHLESQFKPGMNWENRGMFGWHIDHIRPCKSFDLQDPNQQMQCFHYSNLQPLWWKENMKKHAKWDGQTSMTI